MKACFYESGSTDPYENLALEEYLLRRTPDTVILYLWQNENTVVIGKNQNPWKECKTTLLEREGGRLARRLSGGGAVYHDLGNLNFTLLMPQDRYSLERQQRVIREAVSAFGVDVELSGRNDLLAEGQKFSGNAFYKNGKAAYHHGTLLVEADMEKMSRYLSPSRAKLAAKGVDSVRSRVVNLKQLAPEMTVEGLKTALKASFQAEYGPAEPIVPGDRDRIRTLKERYGSWEWIYGPKLPFTLECEERFPWGSVQLQLQVSGGVIQAARIYSDAMDPGAVPRWERALTGCRLEGQALAALPVPEELRRLLLEQCL